jgi:glycosyltransferase involved in cell wall biosynthesis
MVNDTKKKLVLMVPQLRRGGAERVVSRLSFILNEFYDVTIVVFDNSNITYDYGCELVTLNAKPDPNSHIIKKLFNIIKRIYLYNKFKRKNGVDITYSFGDTANIINVFSSGNDKKIISIRGFKRVRVGKDLKDKYFLKPLSKLICNKSDEIIAVSNLMSETIVKEYNLPASKIKTSYNGYDTENIISLSNEKLSREDHERFGSDRIIVTAGTFRSAKGYWHLIKAFSIVLKREKNVKLLILGEDDGQNRRKVEKLAEALKISRNIIYGGYQKNPYKYFKRSTLYVLSSTSEGFPNALVEAMTCGLPIIASDCKSGPREIVAPDTDIFSSAQTVDYGKYGILVKEMNEEEDYDHLHIEECDQHLAEGILELLKNEQLQLEYVEKSKQRAKDFSYANWLENQLEILSGDKLYDEEYFEKN